MVDSTTREKKWRIPTEGSGELLGELEDGVEEEEELRPHPPASLHTKPSLFTSLADPYLPFPRIRIRRPKTYPEPRCLKLPYKNFNI